MQDNNINCGGTSLSKKPKYMENFWKNLIFIYACLILSFTLSLSLNSIQEDNAHTNKTIWKYSLTSSVLDVFLTVLYSLASSIFIALFVYLHINRHQTFEEAKKENSKSSEIHYSMHGEKVGLYLRFGVVLIGLLSLVHIGLSTARSKLFTQQCFSWSSGLVSLSEIVFFIVQALFILKYHSIVILKNTRLIRFGLYNIVFINVTIWEIASLSKIRYSFIKVGDKVSCSDTSIEAYYLYFLPAVSEYSVICMAIIYEIMKRLGKLSLIETMHWEDSKNIFWKIRKSIAGLIIGVVIVLICIGFTLIIIILGSKDKPDQDMIYDLHNGEEIVMYIFTIVILLLAFSKTSKLKFSFTYLSNNVDKNLLFVSCFLSIAFSVMVSTYCFHFSTNSQMLIRAIAALIEIVQIIIQTYVIQDAFYRCSENIEQQKSKPGQGYLAILIGCNFGLWIFKSFQLKKGDKFLSHVLKDSNNQSKILIIFFAYATLPLSILYRYHSSSCLADVFSKIYQGEVSRFEGLLRAEGFEKYGITTQEETKISIPRISVLEGTPTLGRPRATTLPVLPHVENLSPKPKKGKTMNRRETMKSLETAKLRVLSSHFSHNMVTKKLSATVAPTNINSSTLSLDDSDNERSPKINKKDNLNHTKKHTHSDPEMSTIKQLVVANIFHSPSKRKKSADDTNKLTVRSVKFSQNPIKEHDDEEAF